MKTRKIWFLSCTLIMLMCLTSIATANTNDKKRTIGLSMFYGIQVPEDSIWHSSSKYDWNYTMFCSSTGWKLSNRWEVYLEGTIGWYNFYETSDTFSFGIGIMTTYDFIKFSKYSLFIEWGIGIGWWDRTPSIELVNKGLLAHIQYGTGLEFPIKDKLSIKLAYRFNHTSALPRDSGANTYGILFGIKKTW